jgi:hypothetical protein
MKRPKEFPFEHARRITSAEVKMARKAIKEKLEIKQKSYKPPKFGALKTGEKVSSQSLQKELKKLDEDPDLD